jgi:para-nitrobenzyl esterase
MHPTPKRSIVAGCCAALAASCGAPDAHRDSGPPRATLDAGVVEGTYAGADSALAIFKGIPFASPPVGPLRWKPPAPVARWQGIRKADSLPPICPQKRYDIDYFDRLTKRVGGTSPPQPTMPMSEDCLYLSVWTTNLRGTEKQPVMVWVHGGGNVDGWATHGSIDGAPLARRGAVVVMIQYRLGALGFLADSLLTAESPHHSSSNYGLLDQIAALQWVQRNAAAFGGDSTRVTIFGESAGAVDVTCLMVSPLARGLFHRVIAQSGSCVWPVPELGRPVSGLSAMPKAERSGKKLAKNLGVDRERDVLAAMRAKSADEIVAASADDPEISRDVPADGWVIPMQPDLAFAQGMQVNVPVLIGSNEDEMRSLVRAFPVPRMQDYPQLLLEALGGNPEFRPLAPKLLAAYPAADTGTAQRRLFEAGSDGFGASARWLARAMRKAGQSDVYVYRFTHIIPSPGGRSVGAFHGAEMPFVFGNDPGWPKGAQDSTLGEAIRGYWVDFARTGNPNGKGRPTWPAYDSNLDSYLELGDTVRARDHLRTVHFDLQDSALAIVDARLRNRN